MDTTEINWAERCRFDEKGIAFFHGTKCQCKNSESNKPDWHFRKLANEIKICKLHSNINVAILRAIHEKNTLKLFEWHRVKRMLLTPYYYPWHVVEKNFDFAKAL